MTHISEDRYFPMMGVGSGPGPAISQDCDSTKIGLGLHAGSPEEPFPSFVQGDFSGLRVPEQSDDRRSYYAQSVCTQPSIGREGSQRTPSGQDNAEECLNFLPPVSSYTLLDEWSQPVDILLSAQLAGLFSRETQVLDPSLQDENPSMPSESMNLICYRRNLISISGHVAIPAKLRLVENAQGQQIPITSQEIVLSVFESLERGRGGRLIQSLRSGPPISAAAEADSDSPSPEPIPLEPEKAEEGSQDQEYVIFPFEWQRLQFRKATPNNGKSRDRQKYFFVSIKILAHLADGQKVSISEATSNAIVVRGRGPQNFVAKDSQKVGRSRSLNSTNEGRLKKPNRHATRNSLLRQSLSRKARADSTSASSDALQRMSIEDLSALFQETTSADARSFTVTHGPLSDIDRENSMPRNSSPSAGFQNGHFSHNSALRSSSIPPRFDSHRSVTSMPMDGMATDPLMFSPEGYSDSSPLGYPSISSVSPQEIEKKHNNGYNFSHPLSPPRSEGMRSSSVGAEQRYQSPFEQSSGFNRDASPSLARNQPQTTVYSTMDSALKDESEQNFPMSPPEDDFKMRRSVSVSAPGSAVNEEKLTPFPMTPMSPSKEPEVAAGLNRTTSSTTLPEMEKTIQTDIPSNLSPADLLPSPRTQMEIFDRILTPFPPYQGVDNWQAADIMTPIKEQAEPRAFPELVEPAQIIPSITEPNAPQNILAFADQLDSKPATLPADRLEIISIPPSTDLMDTDIIPSTEIYSVN